MKICALGMVVLAYFWLNTAEALQLNFTTNAWTTFITREDKSTATRKQVVTDPLTRRGKVLQVTYEPSDMSGTQFDVDHFKNNPKQVCLTYSVLFPNGFDFVKGGKLPGLYGGGPERCSRDRHHNCFSTRMMWREAGAGEVYIYLTNSAGARSKGILCRSDDPSSKCPGEYGWSYKRGAVTFFRGKWNTVFQRVRMNTIGQADGELYVIVNNGTISAKGLTWRTRGDGITIRGLFFSTFFGGGDRSYAPKKQEKAYFKNISIYEC